MKKYTRDEVVAASTEYFGGDEFAANVSSGKYFLKDDEDNYLEQTPSDLHWRMADEFARIESKYVDPRPAHLIYKLFAKVPGRNGMGPVIPQGSPMSAMGNPYKLQSLSNCFVIESPEDSYGGIFYTDQQEGQIMKRRGGVGLDLSTLRPKGLPTANAAGTTDGISVFMERFSNTCREVAQGGRRGALMQTISIKHPEIERFIHIKRDRSKVTGANISIRVTDDFMRAVESDGDFTLQWPVDVPLEKAKISRTVKARDIWEQLVDAAWDSAEPGILFWDTATRWTPADAYASKGYRSISTNPCGEIVLSAYDSCRLLVVDLTHFVDRPFTARAHFNFVHFDAVVQESQRLMDDLVDLELEAVEKIINKIESDPESDATKLIELDLWKKIYNAGKNGRRTGLGITGLGDALAMLGVRYGSDESVIWTDNIYRALALGAYRATVQLAKERGPFPAYDYELEKDHPFIQRIMAEDPKLAEEYKKYGRRNIALTTTAPVGSVSTMTQTTSGIEPAFMLSYDRFKKINPNDKDAKVHRVDKMGDKWTKFTVYHHGFKQWMDVTGKSNVEESPYYKATSADVDWVQSVKVQAAAQKWICHSISKTCNLPKDASHELVSRVYMEAWKSGCKGFTVYRDGSRDGVLVAPGSNKVTFDLAARLDGVPDHEIEKTLLVGHKYGDFIPDAHKAYLADVRLYLLKRAEGGERVEESTPGENHAARRPKELTCKIHRVNVRRDGENETYLVLVGLNDGRPYELFCGLSEHVTIPRKYDTGVLVKNGKKNGVATYNLQIPVGDDDEAIVFKDVVNLFDNPTYGAFTRTLSLALRHNIPIHYIVEQLQKDKHSDMQSFSRVIARVLKSYISDGTKATEKACDSCGAEGTLIYEEGCMKCTSCGNSKCG